MTIHKFLVLLTAASLTAGCASSTLVPPSPEPSTTPITTDTPKLPIEGSPTAPPIRESPTKPVSATAPPLPPPGRPQPPPREDDFSPSPAAMAQDDLAHRLQVDVAWVQAVATDVREINAEVKACLSDASLSPELQTDLNEVQWITLSVKGNIHHYVALGDLVVYCEE